eukprot:3232544-Rhodomonas_salina.1
MLLQRQCAVAPGLSRGFSSMHGSALVLKLPPSKRCLGGFSTQMGGDAQSAPCHPAARFLSSCNKPSVRVCHFPQALTHFNRRRILIRPDACTDDEIRTGDAGKAGRCERGAETVGTGRPCR